MIRDLAKHRSNAEQVTGDVTVIGAGIAGLLVASQLRKAGRKVVVLESGGRKQEEETHPLNEVVHTAQIYSGAENGRFRGLGGTSSRWGGAMLPFEAVDMGPHTANWDASWPIEFDTIAPFIPEV